MASELAGASPTSVDLSGSTALSTTTGSDLAVDETAGLTEASFAAADLPPDPIEAAVAATLAPPAEAVVAAPLRVAGDPAQPDVPAEPIESAEASPVVLAPPAETTPAIVPEVEVTVVRLADAAFDQIETLADTADAVAADVDADAQARLSQGRDALFDIQQRLAALARAQVDASVALWSEWVSARSPGDVYAANTAYLRRQMEAWMTGSAELTGLSQAMARSALEPIRFTGFGGARP